MSNGAMSETDKLSSRMKVDNFFRSKGVTGLKDLKEYDENDDSILFCDDGISRAFVVLSAQDSNWGSNIEYYINTHGDYDPFDYMYVEFPGDVSEHLEDIFNVYTKWFVTKEIQP